MAENKKSVILYVDIIHTFEALDDAEAGRLIKHYLRYINDLNPEPPDKLTQIAFEPIKQSLKRDLINWENTKVERSKSGHLGGLKSGEARRSKMKQDEANASLSKQDEANEAVSVSVSVSDSVINKQHVKCLFDPVTFDSIKLYFGFENSKYYNQWRSINNFIGEIQDSARLDEFNEAFKYYKLFKEKSKQITHSFKSFVERDENTKLFPWEQENWKAKYEALTKEETKPFTLSAEWGKK